MLVSHRLRHALASFTLTSCEHSSTVHAKGYAKLMLQLFCVTGVFWDIGNSKISSHPEFLVHLFTTIYIQAAY